MKKKLAFFGVTSASAGHYFAGDGGAYAAGYRNIFTGLNPEVLNRIDGTFPPGGTSEQGKYQAIVIPPVVIVAWWDYSVDGRPGSNANLIGSGFSNAEEMIDAAYERFPSIMNRQPRPVLFNQ